MTQPIVIVSEQLQQPALDLLAQHANIVHATPETVAGVIADADGLVVRTYTQVNDALLAAAPKLKVVARAGVALENVDVLACRARGVEVVHTPAANTLAVVDYVTRMLVELNRRFWPITAAITPEEFHASRSQTYGRFLADCTLGIIGAGRIGSRVGRVAAALGMTVLVNDIRAIELDYPHEIVEKSELYRRSDIITIHTPLTELTRHLICDDTLAQCQAGVQIINAARGGCVDYPALARAVVAGQVSGAAIDCHDPEPIPADYPLLGLENVILTPHAAACVPAAKLRMSMVVTDVIKILHGETPEYAAEDGSF